MEDAEASPTQILVGGPEVTSAFVLMGLSRLARGSDCGVARKRSLAYPPLEGEGRLVASEARYEPGWGDGCLNLCTVQGERLSPHPAAPADDASRRRGASTLPLQGRVSKPCVPR